jgi:hypothetical protein
MVEFKQIVHCSLKVNNLLECSSFLQILLCEGQKLSVRFVSRQALKLVLSLLWHEANEVREMKGFQAA